MRIAIIGTGYVGLVAGACLASTGHQVLCADVDSGKIGLLASGKSPIFEEGLETLLAAGIDRGLLSFTDSLEKAFAHGDVVIVAVGTPSLADGAADLSALWSVIHRMAMANAACTGKLLVIKSTVPPGTCDRIAEALHSDAPGSGIVDVVHNPEFLRQGSAVRDFLHPDRIVVGCGTDEGKRRMRQLYAELDAPVVWCDRTSAELIKYAANAFLATKISFANMIADLSGKLGARVDEVLSGVGLDRRISPHFLKSGAGYGGSCFPKDMKALQALGRSVGCELPLIDAAEQINAARPQLLVNALADALPTLRGTTIAVLGLAFKPMTDDVRQAPSLAVCGLLMAQGARVRAYDPLIRQYPLTEVALFDDIETAITGSDAIILLTEWSAFRSMDWNLVGRAVRTGVIVDGRNLLDWNEMLGVTEQYDLTYVSVGRPPLVCGVAGHSLQAARLSSIPAGSPSAR